MRRKTFGVDPLEVPEQGTGEIDFVSLGRALRAKKLAIIVPVLVAFGLGFATVESITPLYQSTASLILQPQESSFTRPLVDTRSDQQAIDDQAVASQVQLLKSREVASQAITRIGLAGNPEFDPAARTPGMLRTLLQSLSLRRSSKVDPDDDRILDSYFNALDVYQIERSRVLTIVFTSANPEVAAKAANAIADIYIDMQSAKKHGESVGASEALSPQIEALRQKVAKAEAAVEDFRAHNSLFVSSNNANLSTQQLADVTAQLSSARAQLVDAQSKAQLLREMIRSGRPLDVPDLMNNELIRRLSEQRAGLAAQLALEQQTLLPAHPRIKELMAQLAALDNQLVAEAQKAVRSLENDANLVKARVDALTDQLDRQKGAAAASNEKEVALRALEREAKAQRDLLESYLSRFREASTRAAVEDLPPDARVISRAIAPAAPYFPKKGPILLIVTLAALVLSTAFVTARELLSGRAFVPVERGLPAAPAPILASPAVALPLAQRIEAMTAAGRQAPPAVMPAAVSSETTAFADLLARCRRRIGRAHSLVVSGPADGEAISAMASQLGRRLADEGIRTVLVDLAAGPPAGIGEIGLGDIVAGAASFTDAITGDAYSRLHLIPAGRGIEDLDPSTVTTQAELVYHALSLTYDVVIFDGGPLAVDRAPVLLARLVPVSEIAIVVADPSAFAEAASVAASLSHLGAQEVVTLDGSDAGRVAA
jgi:polysaccharide biosynthesis transport protein